LSELKAESLSIRLKNKPILESVSFEVRQGEAALLAGPTGSGKSTLMKAISGILQAVYSGFSTSGSISVYGLSPLAARRKGLISYVPQDPRSFFLGRTVREELKYRGLSSSDFSDFYEKIDIPINDLSSGERYRLITEISFKIGSKVVLFDEPTAFLDDENFNRLMNNIKQKITENGGIAVVADHRARRFEGRIDKTIILPGKSSSCSSPAPFSWMRQRRGELEIDGLRVAKGSKILLDGVSLKLDSGEIISITGPNGSGKSSLLKEVALLTYEKIRKDGAGIRFFYVPEYPLYPFFNDTVEKELESWRAVKFESAAALKELLKAFGLFEKLDKNPFSLSIGESRMLSLLSSLLAEPDVLLIDEPSLGLDACKKKVALEALKSFKSSGGSVLMATHDEEFASISDRTVEISRWAVA